nr:malectin [Actinomycetota bacterium]
MLLTALAMIAACGNIASNHNVPASTIAAAANTSPAGINSGGGQYTSQSGVVYQADTGYSGGAPASTTANITGTNDPALYQTERYGKTFSYNIPLANGNYSVTLKFAEIYWNSSGQRVFNVSIQGTQVITNLDIYALAGKNAAYDVTFPASVTNGVLNIGFTTVVDNAKISAIEITPAASVSSFAANSGGGQYTSQSGVVYQADTGYSGGTPASTTANITGTNDPTLYQTERYGKNFSYNIPLANGNYSVTLKFAEIYWNSSGQRVFNVSIQGIRVINNLDIYALVGKDAAYDVTFPASVTNGILSIGFAAYVDNAKISAIEITPAASVSSFAANSGGGQYTSQSGVVYQADTG